jgi:hypothetical protein
MTNVPIEIPASRYDSDQQPEQDDILRRLIDLEARQYRAKTTLLNPPAPIGGTSNYDSRYLRLDASNDPVTGPLDIQVDSADALRVLTSAGGETFVADTVANKIMGRLDESWVQETKYLVVDAGGLGDYTTIQAALTYISNLAGEQLWTVLVRPGTYAERISIAGSVSAYKTVSLFALGSGVTLAPVLDDSSVITVGVYATLNLYNFSIVPTGIVLHQPAISDVGNSSLITYRDCNVVVNGDMKLSSGGSSVTKCWDCTFSSSSGTFYAGAAGVSASYYLYGCRIDGQVYSALSVAGYLYHCVISGAIFTDALGDITVGRCLYNRSTASGNIAILDGDAPTVAAGSITPAMLANASAQYKLLTSGATPFAYAESGYSLIGTAAATYTMPTTTQTIPGLGVANIFTTTQTITPGTDVVALTINKPASAASLEVKSGATVLASVSNAGLITSTGGYSYVDQNNVTRSAISAVGTNSLYMRVGSTAGYLEFKGGLIDFYGGTGVNEQKSIGLGGGVALVNVNPDGLSTPSGNSFFQVLGASTSTYLIYCYANGRNSVNFGAADTASTHFVKVSNISNKIAFSVLGYSTQTTTTPLVQFARNDTAAGVSALLGLTGLGSGANGDGVSVTLSTKSSTTSATAQASIKSLWVSATHASRTAKLQLSAYDTTERIGLEIAADGVAAITRTIAASEGAYATTAVDLALTSVHHFVTVTAASKTITLPTAVGCSGREYIIASRASGTIIDGNGTETIDGALTQTIYAYETMQLKSDGANWSIV